MSAETYTWLNTLTLIGHTDKRGNAWHYREADQGAESNHYTGSIPREDVTRRLFNFDFAEGTVDSTYLTPDGVTTLSAPDRKAIIRPAGSLSPDDEGAILGIFKEGYQVHPYSQWLVDNVSTLLDGGLDIGSAGLLKGAAVAWVQCEMPDTREVEGVQYRPFLTAATSVDGSLSSTYLTGAQAVVCDNTLSAALSAREDASRVKIRHSKRSLGRVQEVRDALGLVLAVADEFDAQVRELVAEPVSPAAWSRFLELQAPTTDPRTGEPVSSRSLSIAITRQEALSQLWNSDTRVSPWKGTVWGAVQAVNTYTHHVATVRGASRPERNALRMVTGEHDKLDAMSLAQVRTAVLQTA